MAPTNRPLAQGVPRLRKLGAAQRIERSPEYGLRPFWRQLYRVDPRLLRGTPLEGRTSREIDDFWRSAAAGWEQRDHHKVVFVILENHDYQVDVLDDVEPIPDRVSFRSGYAAQRAGLRGSLGLVIGATNGGKPLTSNADTWPHAIIGGSSGGGKSVFVASLLAQVADKSPALVRLALGDLAGSDLGPFARLPHAIAPLADDLPAVLALFGQVEAELTARQAFLTRPLAIHRPDGSRTEIEDGVPSLDTWNNLVARLERPDLALPRVLVAIDEWKQAMDGSDQAMELAALAARVMRVGRKWGGRVWLIAQEPKKGQGKDITFPSDILANADTRIVLAKGGTALLWRLMLGDAASFDADRPRLIGTRGDIVQGRGVFRAAGEDTVFQGLFLSREHDADDLSSELTRHIREAARHAELRAEARLLLERPYAPSGRVLRVAVDPRVPGDAAVRIETAPAPVPSPVKPRTDYTTFFDPPARADPVGQPRDPRAPYREDDAPDPDDEPTPRRPTQLETRRLAPLTALRFLYRAQIAADAQGVGPIEVSRTRLAEMIRQDGRIAPGNVQLTSTLRLLRNRGLLLDDGRCSRLAHGGWTAARDALGDAPGDADGSDAGDDGAGWNRPSADEASDLDAEDDAAQVEPLCC